MLLEGGGRSGLKRKRAPRVWHDVFTGQDTVYSTKPIIKQSLSPLHDQLKALEDNSVSPSPPSFSPPSSPISSPPSSTTPSSADYFQLIKDALSEHKVKAMLVVVLVVALLLAFNSERVASLWRKEDHHNLSIYSDLTN